MWQQEGFTQSVILLCDILRGGFTAQNTKGQCSSKANTTMFLSRQRLIKMIFNMFPLFSIKVEKRTDNTKHTELDSSIISTSFIDLGVHVVSRNMLILYCHIFRLK